MAGTMHHGFKGFSKDLKCRDFQFEAGKTYTHEGDVEPCASGFHWCENPLAVFDFYPPATSRYFRIEASGDTKKDGSKSASATISLAVELTMAEYVQAAVDFASRSEKPSTTATGYCGAASATGYYGAASATGYYGAASATGRQGRVSGKDGNALFLCERNDGGEIIAVWAGIAGKDGIKADTFYTLKGGVPVEVAA